jgi:tetratricopeptide (TPR) repeat protein
MRTTSLVILLIASMVYAEGDRIVMVDDLAIEGRIHEEAPDFIILMVHNEAGRVKIPRNRIKAIEYDFATKAASLADDDYKGHYDLGVWAFQRGMYAEAISELKKVKGQQDVGPDIHKMLGVSYDKQEDFKNAYENYKEHLRTNPDDEEIKTRASELARSVAPENNKVAPTTQKPVTKPKVTEGLEGIFRWYAERWENANKCSVSVTVDPDSGNRVIAVQGQGGGQDKIAVGGSGTRPLDLSESTEMLFMVFHNGKNDARLAVAFINKQGEFFESREQRVAANSWVKMSFKLKEKDFKSAKVGWNYKTGIEGAQNISRVLFLIYGRTDLNMFIDRIFFK